MCPLGLGNICYEKRFRISTNLASLKRKCMSFDEILVIGETKSYEIDKVSRSLQPVKEIFIIQWWPNLFGVGVGLMNKIVCYFL